MTEPDPATQHIDALIAERDAARADLAAANARITELTELFDALRDDYRKACEEVERLQHHDWEDDNAELQARIDKALGVYAFLMRNYANPEADAETVLATARTGLARALAADTPTPATAEPCGVKVGTNPGWMNDEQYDAIRCRCARPRGHEGPHGCRDHDKPADAIHATAEGSDHA